MNTYCSVVAARELCTRYNLVKTECSQFIVSSQVRNKLYYAKLCKPFSKSYNITLFTLFQTKTHSSNFRLSASFFTRADYRTPHRGWYVRCRGLRVKGWGLRVHSFRRVDLVLPRVVVSTHTPSRSSHSRNIYIDILMSLVVFDVQPLTAKFVVNRDAKRRRSGC